MSNPVGPRAAHARHRSRERREGRLRAGGLPRRARGGADPRRADVRRRRPLPPRAGGGRCGLRRARRGLLGAHARDRARARVWGAGRSPAWRASAWPAPRSPGVRLEALAASAATPGFVQALLRLVSELEEQRIEPGRWWAAMRAWGEREPARAVYAEELARLYGAYRDGLRAIERRDRVLHDQAALDALRVEPARWGATPVLLYGFDDLQPLQRDAIETLAVARRRARSPCRSPTRRGAPPSPGAARPSRSSWRCAPSTSSCRRAPSTTRGRRCTPWSARCSRRPPPAARTPATRCCCWRAAASAPSSSSSPPMSPA